MRAGSATTVVGTTRRIRSTSGVLPGLEHRMYGGRTVRSLTQCEGKEPNRLFGVVSHTLYERRMVVRCPLCWTLLGGTL